MLTTVAVVLSFWSAGGYTTLATFKAGASLFGISDLNSLNEEMPPKFELHYTAISVVDSCYLIVTPVQARKVHKALKQKGLPVALVEYEGEQHGFRKAENIKHTVEQQMMFFARLIGHFKVADEITPIKVDNVD
ncbi:hypothetical protein MKX01_034314 [Papaver californicum]|nr:hypothetical protein MKX01_034314 [Papaver californicum]